MASTEIELKLRLGRGGAAKLRRHPALRRYRVGRGSGASLDSTYFDTPALDLAKRGWALRIRRDGDRLEQTLKIHRKGGGLHAETSVGGGVSSWACNIAGWAGKD